MEQQVDSRSAAFFISRPVLTHTCVFPIVIGVLIGSSLANGITFVSFAPIVNGSLWELKPLRLEVCHGSTVFHPAEQLDEYVEKVEKKLGAI